MTRYEMAANYLATHNATGALAYLRDLKASHDRLLDVATRAIKFVPTVLIEDDAFAALKAAEALR